MSRVGRPVAMVLSALGGLPGVAAGPGLGAPGHAGGAGGAPQSRLTREARGSLARLAKRP